MIDFGISKINNIQIGSTQISEVYAGRSLVWRKSDPIPEDMLTFTAIGEPSTIQLNKVGTPYSVSLEYCIDDGEWNTFTPGSTVIELDAGQKAYLRSTVEDPNGTNHTPFSKDDNNYYWFTMTSKIAASGNIQYLIDKTGQRTSVASYCYSNMFYSCTSLTQAPELPATTLADSCYSNMFIGCTSLAQAPALPATNVNESCYYSMFRFCSNLNEIKVGFKTWWSSLSGNKWMNGVSANGIFTCPSQLPIEFGDGRIPEGWTILNIS